MERHPHLEIIGYIQNPVLLPNTNSSTLPWRRSKFQDKISTSSLKKKKNLVKTQCERYKSYQICKRNIRELKKKS